MYILRALLGMAVFVAILYALSSNRRRIDWRLVGTALTLQLVFGVLVLRVDIVRGIVDAIGNFFVKILDFNRAGAEFLFGGLVTNTQTFGFLFAFNVLPTIIFFSALTSLLFYLGILQRIVYGFAWAMSRTMKLSGAESLSASSNIFLGQTEAPLLIRHYLPTMTKSELMAVMVGGMATIAGAVMVAYIGMLGGPTPEGQLLFAKHLITASVLSAPAGLLCAKMLEPQTEEVNTEIHVSREKIGANALEAISNGTTDGLRLAINVGAMLLVFTAMIAFVNWILSSWIGGWTGINGLIANITGGQYTQLTMQAVTGIVFAPLAWLMGIDQGQLMISGQIIGEKTILNEFYAYGTLAKVRESGVLSDVRAQIILTYALCGFSNIASIGIQIGGIGALAPNQRSTLARLGVRALIGGSIACFLTACVASMLI
jgi:concentrative nucleoside transporter, CNT family